MAPDERRPRSAGSGGARRPAGLRQRRRAPRPARRRRSRRHRGPHRAAPRVTQGRPCATWPKRPAGCPPSCSPTMPPAVVDDPDIDVVVEVIGGIDPARDLCSPRSKAGKPVVTGQQGAARQRTAPSCSQPPRPPASTCCSRRRSPAASRSSARCASRWSASTSAGCMGIVNGTTNYILTRMTEEGAYYADALAEAQALGYAEADPTADVEGFDAGAKAAIIATHRVRRRRRRRRRPPRGHLGHHRRRHRATPAAWARHQAARRRRAGRRRRHRPCASTRPWCRRRTRSPRCARASTPCSSRATPSATSCSTGGARAARPPPARCSAT